MSTARIKGLVGLAICLALLTACAGAKVEYIESDTGMTRATARELLDRTDIAYFSDMPAEKVSALRHRALTDLQAEGSRAQAAAAIVTRTLPSESAGVPVLVERADFEGVPAILVIEAVPDADRLLRGARMWVLTEKGDVLFYATR